jgi:hypothetical protein
MGLVERDRGQNNDREWMKDRGGFGTYTVLRSLAKIMGEIEQNMEDVLGKRRVCVCVCTYIMAGDA